jgi:hypothetical protein
MTEFMTRFYDAVGDSKSSSRPVSYYSILHTANLDAGAEANANSKGSPSNNNHIHNIPEPFSPPVVALSRWPGFSWPGGSRATTTRPSRSPHHPTGVNGPRVTVLRGRSVLYAGMQRITSLERKL